ncbi:contact-dependent growth inhibition system immunity protein [Streptomyces sp. CB03238]|uniref:contact-dependent growth inhibition system immunity protein n=1 Tax=Streptomyces sp. CB03238 TaxID=1907777 RepID=UPI001F4EDAA6|nr:contact-dependent growth inhibition system immunity protein [Streptomyces sp. CB03238]
MDDRFGELRRLLRSYEVTGYAFDDSAASPGAALSAYLRQAERQPSRAAAAAREIDDLLAVGLVNDEIADDVDLLPHIDPPAGRSVEECLRVIRGHLQRLMPAGEEITGRPGPRPETSWEWRERFPELAHLLGAYFHQDFDAEYASHRAAVDDYLSGVSPDDPRAVTAEIEDFLALNPDDAALRQSARITGLGVGPPAGVPLRRWLADLADIVAHHPRS